MTSVLILLNESIGSSSIPQFSDTVTESYQQVRWQRILWIWVEG